METKENYLKKKREEECNRNISSNTKKKIIPKNYIENKNKKYIFFIIKNKIIINQIN